MLGTALALAARGMSVFPCVPGKKEPACTHGCKAATTDTDTIRQWWRFEPNYNVAIATGAISGVFVVDIDGFEAETKLGRLEAEHGMPLPPTVETITPRGRHLFFKMPQGPVGNSAGRIATGIDVRGAGGYVLAPPSVHPSGRRYEWSVDCAPKIAEAPTWLLDRINGHGKHKQITPASEWRELVSAGADEGQRNDACTRLSGYLLRRNVDAFMALGLLQAWNATCCRPPLPEEEITQIVNSVCGLELRRRGVNG
jgi:Bifunctional DNA primase/polymerase, N-terminal/Primase C terminal 1 (PriCT-1)